jgi:hypothetical protein
MTSVNRSDVFPPRKRAPTETTGRRHDGLEMVRHVPKGDAPKRRPRVNLIVVLASMVRATVAPPSALRKLANATITTVRHAWVTAAQGIIRHIWAIIGVRTVLRTWAITVAPAVLRTLPITRPAANEAQCLRIIPVCEMAEDPNTASRAVFHTMRRSVMGRSRGTSPRIAADRTIRGCTLATHRLVRKGITRKGITNITATMRRGAMTGIAGIRRIVGRISVTIADTTGTMLTTGRTDTATRTAAITIARIMRRTLRTDKAMTETARRIATAASADVQAIGMTIGDRIAGLRTVTTAIVGRRAIVIEIRMMWIHRAGRLATSRLWLTGTDRTERGTSPCCVDCCLSRD